MKVFFKTREQARQVSIKGSVLVDAKKVPSVNGSRWAREIKSVRVKK